MNVSAKIKGVLKTLLFLCLVAVVFLYVNGLMMPRGVVYAIQLMYNDRQFKNTDVLVLGSSQTRYAYNPAVFWEEQGIALYNLSVNGQNIPETYFYLVEALKYASPSLVMVDIEGVSRYMHLTDENHINNNVLLMRPSLNKYRMIQAVAPDKMADYFIPFFGTHNNWETLTEDNFHQTAKTHEYEDEPLPILKGYHPLFITRPVDFAATTAITEAGTLPDEVRMYLDKIIGLAAEKGIDLLFVDSKDTTLDEEAPVKNAFYAEYFGRVEILNYNAIDLAISGETDMSDLKHQNVYGAAKTSSFTAGYLAGQYGLADHRGQAGYSSWDACVETYHALLLEQQQKLAQAQAQGDAA